MPRHLDLNRLWLAIAGLGWTHNRRAAVPGGMPRGMMPPSPFSPPHPGRKVAGAVSVLDMVRLCPGGRHGWFNSAVGIIRKPLANAAITGGGSRPVHGLVGGSES